MYIELYNTSHELKLKENKFLFEINSTLLIDNYYENIISEICYFISSRDREI